MLTKTESATHGNFNLKNIAVDLVPAGPARRTEMTVTELETMRTRRRPVPASKHGLEAICGASCETGAQ
jgi:hypothetical protein